MLIRKKIGKRWKKPSKPSQLKPTRLYIYKGANVLDITEYGMLKLVGFWLMLLIVVIWFFRKDL